MWYNDCMSNRLNNKRYFKRRASGRSGGLHPVIRFIVSAIGILLALGIIVLAAMITLEAVFKVDTPITPDGVIAHGLDKLNAGNLLICSPTPYVTPEPTPVPKPMDSFNGGEAEREIVLPNDMSYPWFGKPYCYGNKIICSAGKLVNGKSLMVSLLEYDIASETVKKLDIESKNGQLLNPVFNDSWLIYLDGNTSNGGGDICVIDLKSGSMAPTVIKTVYVCQPEFKLDGDYFTWLERTGTSKDKIFVCHIPSGETTVIRSFTQSGYGTSMPSSTMARSFGLMMTISLMREGESLLRSNMSIFLTEKSLICFPMFISMIRSVIPIIMPGSIQRTLRMLLYTSTTVMTPPL